MTYTGISHKTLTVTVETVKAQQLDVIVQDANGRCRDCQDPTT
jgi:hypothetical protein